MSINQIALEGHVGFYAISNENDKEKIYIRLGLNVQSKWRKDPENKEKYAYDNFICKAFGHTANFMKDYRSIEKGDIIAITGDVYLEDGYVNAKGETVLPQLAVRITDCGVPTKKAGGNTTISEEVKPTALPTTEGLPTSANAVPFTINKD